MNVQEVVVGSPVRSYPCLKVGQGERTALCLHGFPEAPQAMVGIMQQLAAQGYTCYAPYMMGYGQPLSHRRFSRRRWSTVQLTDLVEDINALAVSLVGQTQKLLLVGHDWGAVSGYATVAAHPERFHHFIAMSVPPLPAFLRNLVKHPSQFLRSWYMLFFQLRLSIPERVLMRNDLGLVKSLYRLWSPNWQVSGAQFEHVRQAIGDSHTMRAAVNYYRGLLQPTPAEWRLWEQGRKLAYTAIRVPTLILVGDQDQVIPADMFAGYERHFKTRVRFHIVLGAGHFLPLEAPTDVAEHITQFVR